MNIFVSDEKKINIKNIHGGEEILLKHKIIKTYDYKRGNSMKIHLSVKQIISLYISERMLMFVSVFVCENKPHNQNKI